MPVSREQIHRYVGGVLSRGWASRALLLRTAYDNNAPREVTTRLATLPETLFRDLDDVCAHLAETGSACR